MRKKVKLGLCVMVSVGQWRVNRKKEVGFSGNVSKQKCYGEILLRMMILVFLEV